MNKAKNSIQNKGIAVPRRRTGRFVTPEGTLLECYISVFVRRLTVAMKKGTIRHYVAVEENEAFLKGKLLLPQHILLFSN